MVDMTAKILLLQDAAYLPSFGGGNKANRLLIEALAALGFECQVISRLPDERRVLADRFGAVALIDRGLDVTVEDDGSLSYVHRGVDVTAVDTDAPATAARIETKIASLQPDWILVSDDHRALFLGPALQAASDRTIILVHTHWHLPFGPEARASDPIQHDRMRRARGIVVVSDYSRRYLRDFGNLNADLIRFPVFGQGPFPVLGNPDIGHVTLINPCPSKGLAVFLDLADHFADIAFAAVPTWGADDAVFAALAERPNIAVLSADDDIGTVLQGTRVLLAPSQIPETFGYVGVDAMLRGIPVMAGNLGGQPEAKLGVDFVLPVGDTDDGSQRSGSDSELWRTALSTLLYDSAAYIRCAQASRQAALRFLSETDTQHFVNYLVTLEGRASPHGVMQFGLQGAAT
jgi:glycosyltransferase involved in cell wall biosynthesis